MKLLLLILCLLAGVLSFSQQTIPAAGGDASGSRNSSENQGVQQPFEVFLITDKNKHTDIRLQMKVYPNSTDGQLVFNTGEFILEKAYYKQLDLSDKLPYESWLSYRYTDIQMYHYSAGAYLMEVS